MIEVNNLSFSYKKKARLFEQLQLNLNTGNIYGLLGRNGAGKTSLLKIISGMLYPDKGTCLLNGMPTNKRLPKTYRDIFFIPEEFELPNLSIHNFVRIHSAFYPNFQITEFQNYLIDFKVDYNNAINELSFGQKKMVIISFGLASNTKYLILDEPTNALDIPSKALLRKMLANAINDDRSFLISTHQVRDLDTIIDPIIILDQGQIIFHHTCDEVMNGLCFKTLKDSDNDSAIYVEERMGIKDAICINYTNDNTRINMELLFNGIVANPDAINQVLTQK